jgi:hypothetical protein
VTTCADDVCVPFEFDVCDADEVDEDDVDDVMYVM